MDKTEDNKRKNRGHFRHARVDGRSVGAQQTASIHLQMRYRHIRVRISFSHCPFPFSLAVKRVSFSRGSIFHRLCVATGCVASRRTEQRKIFRRSFLYSTKYCRSTRSTFFLPFSRSTNERRAIFSRVGVANCPGAVINIRTHRGSRFLIFSK